jgi:type VI secretion system protein ImpF
MSRTPSDRYSPTIMHAFRAAFEARDARKKMDLRGEEGERIVASRRIPLRFGMRNAVVRDELARDLSNLLNTVNLAAAEDLSEVPLVERSILNFGLSDLGTASEERSIRSRLAEDIMRVLDQYEPRLIKGSIRIEPYEPERSDENTLCFMVHAEMKGTPVNLGLEFIAEIEQGAKRVEVRKLATQ